MSDILDRKIAAMMEVPRIEISGSLSEAEIRDAYDFQLEQLTRLTAALDILFPDRPRAGVASIQAAIDKLEMLSTVIIALEAWADATRLWEKHQHKTPLRKALWRALDAYQDHKG